MGEGLNYRFLDSVDQEINLYVACMFVFSKKNVTVIVVGIGQGKYVEKQPSSEYIVRVFRRSSRNDLYDLCLGAI